MSDYGDLNPSDVLDMKFTTVAATGAPTQLAGTPAISIYKDNSTTQTTTGVTLTVDFDTVTGLNNLRIDTSADGAFYSAGSNFQAVITTGTVGGVSVVGYVVGSFSIQARAALRPTVAGNTLDVTADGRAGIDWANVEGQDATVALTGTTIKTATDVEAATTNLQGRVPAALGSGGRMSSTLDAVPSEPAAVFAWGVDNLDAIIAFIGAVASNRLTETATAQLLRNRANTATIATATVSDDGTTAVRGSLT